MFTLGLIFGSVFTMAISWLIKTGARIDKEG